MCCEILIRVTLDRWIYRATFPLLRERMDASVASEGGKCSRMKQLGNPNKVDIQYYSITLLGQSELKVRNGGETDVHQAVDAPVWFWLSFKVNAVTLRAHPNVFLIPYNSSDYV